MGKEKPLYIIGENITLYKHNEKHGGSQEIKIKLPYDSAIPVEYISKSNEIIGINLK